MPIIKNVARQLTLSVRVSGATDAPYAVSPWPNDATAKMYYSQDGGAKVEVIPSRIDATTGNWLLPAATLTASVWNCDELRIFWEGTGISSGHAIYYPEAHYTDTVAGRIDVAVSTRSSHTAADVWAAATRTLTAISDSAGITTLLSRLTNTRATNLDNLDATVSSRLSTAGYTAPLDAAGVRTALGLASANLDTQLDALPTAAENATAMGALTPAAGFFTNAPSGGSVLSAGQLQALTDLGVMIENDGLASAAFTAGALANSPSGAGLSPTITTALQSMTDAGLTTDEWEAIAMLAIGRMVVDAGTSREFLYKRDGVTVLKTFNLTAASGGGYSARTPI